VPDRNAADSSDDDDDDEEEWCYDQQRRFFKWAGDGDSSCNDSFSFLGSAMVRYWSRKQEYESTGLGILYVPSRISVQSKLEMQNARRVGGYAAEPTGPIGNVLQAGPRIK